MCKKDMLKFYDYAVTFAEFPDEIALCVNISNCPGHCGHMENGEFKLDCSEPWLLDDIGTYLTNESIDLLIKEHSDITVFGIMGGDNNQEDVIRIANYIHSNYSSIKVGMYSGREFLNMKLLDVLDFYKIGRFIMPQGEVEDWKYENAGPITLPISNQLMFEKKEINDEIIWLNTTYKFRRNKIYDWKSSIIYPEDNKY